MNVLNWFRIRPRIFHLYATERSGHHSVMFWLMHQFRGIKYYQDLQENGFFRYVEYRKKHIIVRNDKQDQDFDDYKAKIIIYNYELCEIQHDHPIIVLRDFRNTFASLMQNSPSKNVVPSHHGRMETWKNRAEAVLNKQGYFINYNLYNWNQEYRQQICRDLKLHFTDIGINHIPHTGSSFTKLDPKKFQRDQLNRRYLKFQDHHEFKYYMNIYRDCVHLSDQIFGDI